MGDFCVRCWRALGNLSLMDWLLGFGKLSLLGILAGAWAWLEQLPIVLSGLIAFTCGYLVWTGIVIRKSLAATVPIQSEALREEISAHATDRNETAFLHGFNKARLKSNPSEKAAVLRLTQLRGEGVRIRNDGALVDDNNINEWLSAVVDWMNEVIEVIQRIDEADSEYFKTLDVVTPARVQCAINLGNKERIRDFVRTYNQHDLRLVRLDNLLKKYGVAA